MLTQIGCWLLWAGLILPFCALKASDSQVDDLSAQEGKIIRNIEFVGKFKLRHYILYREIGSRKGQPLSSAVLSLDRKKIDSFGIFSEVRPEITARGDSVDVTFHLTEIWTLTPIASAGVTDKSFDWMVGAHERDVLGFYLNARAYYRRFEGENSYVFSGVFPRAFGKDLALGLSLEYAREKDPLVMDSHPVFYRYLNKSIYGSAGIRVGDFFYPGIFAGYDRENWQLLNPDDGGDSVLQMVDYPRYLFGPSLAIGRIYSDHYYYTGTSLSTSLTMIRELPEGSFDSWRLQFVESGYFIFRGLNICLRGQYFLSSANERVMPYAISGNDNVRGYRDRIIRGDQFLGGNAEVRRKFLESRRFYFQVASFLDAGSIWSRRRSFSDGINDIYWSVGGGLRFSFKQYPKLGRFDIAFDTRSRTWVYYLAASQFF